MSEVSIARLEERLDGLDARYAQRFDDTATAVAAAFASAKEAIAKAEAAQERRNELSNEFRGQLSDQARTFMPRVEAEKEMEAMSKRLEAVEKQSGAVAASRAAGNAIYGYLIGAAGVITAALALILTR